MISPLIAIDLLLQKIMPMSATGSQNQELLGSVDLSCLATIIKSNIPLWSITALIEPTITRLRGRY